MSIAESYQRFKSRFGADVQSAEGAKAGGDGDDDDTSMAMDDILGELAYDADGAPMFEIKPKVVEQSN